MLEIISLRKDYEGRQILKLPSMRLDHNIYWLKGENGSGKTTFLKMLAGLLAFEGSIVFDGVDLKKQATAYRSQIAWAEAEPLYPPFLTGLELLRFYTDIRKAAEEDSLELIRLFDMEKLMPAPVATYSTGMLKKLSLLLAFTGNARLLLLDEPLITLDAATLDTVCHYLRRRYEENGALILFTSHQPPGDALQSLQKQILVKDQTLVLA